MLNNQSITSSHNEPQRSPEIVQKQPLEVFCKKSCSYDFRKFHRKTPVCSFFLITLLVFRPATSLKRYTSSIQKCSTKRAVLKNFAKFCKVVGLQACNFIKKKLEHRCFSVNIVKFLRTPSLNNTYKPLLVKILQQCRKFHWKIVANFANIKNVANFIGKHQCWSIFRSSYL